MQQLVNKNCVHKICGTVEYINILEISWLLCLDIKLRKESILWNKLICLWQYVWHCFRHCRFSAYLSNIPPQQTTEGSSCVIKIIVSFYPSQLFPCYHKNGISKYLAATCSSAWGFFTTPYFFSGLCGRTTIVLRAHISTFFFLSWFFVEMSTSFRIFCTIKAFDLGGI